MREKIYLIVRVLAAEIINLLVSNAIVGLLCFMLGLIYHSAYGHDKLWEIYDFWWNHDEDNEDE